MSTPIDPTDAAPSSGPAAGHPSGLLSGSSLPSTVSFTPSCSPARVFLAVLGRDLHVTRKEMGTFLAQVLIQPFFFLFIFATVLGGAGYVSADYGQIMLPGLLALNAFFGALQAVALPLVVDFAWTREIEDRLLAPIPIPLIAVEKIIFGAVRGVLASVLMVPIGYVVLPDITWPASGLAPAFLCIVLGAVLGGAIGLAMGTLVPARRINVLFALLLAPLMFTGSVQFPWRALENQPWFQVVCALNPLTYVSEGIRASLVPAVPHLPYGLCVLVTVVATAVLVWVGLRGFLRRSLD